DTLARFDAVIWNNVSGDVLTLSQRKVFEDYINAGGGYVGIHGSGGDALNFWDWYVNTLLGARFIGHPMDPQLQDADIRIEEQPSGIGATVAPGWTMQDEWYSFQTSPRAAGASVIATLDEESYTQKGYGGTDLRMGDDHPIVWTRCVGDGRVFYTAIGHRPEVYNVPQTIRLLKDGVVWAAGKGNSTCSFGKEQEIQE
ncbi:MAG: ThuA domain-containing protein, partial [Halioglobus sp.]|nr:ThuA domain-containing protein [Halioglobus sp.]